MVRSSNSVTYEEGYHAMQAYLVEHLDDLIALMLAEQDPNMRGRFVELLGDSRVAKVIPLLCDELENPNREVRMWAYNALENIEHPDAERAIQEFRVRHPDADFL